MKLLQRVSAWCEEEFSHTVLIFQNDDEIFYALSPHRYRSDADVDIHNISLALIPTAHIWPVFPENHTQASRPFLDDCFVKRPNLSMYGDLKDSRIGEVLLAEAKTCEYLRQFPHPNIAQFLGCVVQNNRITGLCFTRYNGTLMERVEDGTLFNRDTCLVGIKKGIQHLHRLGLVHNDINPLNIMIAVDETPVIIDFDSCRPEGTGLGFKAGTVGWTDETVKISHSSNDYYGLAKVQEFLCGKSSNS